MLGVVVNTVAVLIGGTIGLFAKKGIPIKWKDVLMKGLALCTIYIGIRGSFDGQNTLVLILSIVLGAVIGQGFDLDKRLKNLADRIEKRFKREGKEESIAEGFVAASLLFCVGALTIVGSLQAGLTGDNEMLFTKSTLDFIASIILAATLGIGVLFSASFVFVFQGMIVLLAKLVAPFLGDDIILEMTSAGSLLIIAIGLNLIGLTKLKVMNYLPAIFLPIGLVPLYNIIERLF